METFFPMLNSFSNHRRLDALCNFLFLISMVTPSIIYLSRSALNASPSVATPILSTAPTSIFNKDLSQKDYGMNILSITNAIPTINNVVFPSAVCATQSPILDLFMSFTPPPPPPPRPTISLPSCPRTGFYNASAVIDPTCPLRTSSYPRSSPSSSRSPPLLSNHTTDSESRPNTSTITWAILLLILVFRFVTPLIRRHKFDFWAKRVCEGICYGDAYKRIAASPQNLSDVLVSHVSSSTNSFSSLVDTCAPFESRTLFVSLDSDTESAILLLATEVIDLDSPLPPLIFELGTPEEETCPAPSPSLFKSSLDISPSVCSVTLQGQSIPVSTSRQSESSSINVSLPDCNFEPCKAKQQMIIAPISTPPAIVSKTIQSSAHLTLASEQIVWVAMGWCFGCVFGIIVACLGFRYFHRCEAPRRKRVVPESQLVNDVVLSDPTSTPEEQHLLEPPSESLPSPSAPNTPVATLRDDDDDTISSTPSGIALVLTIPDVGVEPTVVTDISPTKDTSTAVLEPSVMTTNTILPEEVLSTPSQTLIDPFVPLSPGPAPESEADWTLINSDVTASQVLLIEEGGSSDVFAFRPTPSSPTPQALQTTPSTPSASTTLTDIALAEPGFPDPPSPFSLNTPSFADAIVTESSSVTLRSLPSTTLSTPSPQYEAIFTSSSIVIATPPLSATSSISPSTTFSKLPVAITMTCPSTSASANVPLPPTAPPTPPSTPPPIPCISLQPAAILPPSSGKVSYNVMPDQIPSILNENMRIGEPSNPDSGMTEEACSVSESVSCSISASASFPPFVKIDCMERLESHVSNETRKCHIESVELQSIQRTTTFTTTSADNTAQNKDQINELPERLESAAVPATPCLATSSVSPMNPEVTSMDTSSSDRVVVLSTNDVLSVPSTPVDQIVFGATEALVIVPTCDLVAPNIGDVAHAAAATLLASPSTPAEKPDSHVSDETQKCKNLEGTPIDNIAQDKDQSEQLSERWESAAIPATSLSIMSSEMSTNPEGASSHDLASSSDEDHLIKPISSATDAVVVAPISDLVPPNVEVALAGVTVPLATTTPSVDSPSVVASGSIETVTCSVDLNAINEEISAPLHTNPSASGAIPESVSDTPKCPTTGQIDPQFSQETKRPIESFDELQTPEIASTDDSARDEDRKNESLPSIVVSETSLSTVSTELAMDSENISMVNLVSSDEDRLPTSCTACVPISVSVSVLTPSPTALDEAMHLEDLESCDLDDDRTCPSIEWTKPPSTTQETKPSMNPSDELQELKVPSMDHLARDEDRKSESSASVAVPEPALSTTSPESLRDPEVVSIVNLASDEDRLGETPSASGPRSESALISGPFPPRNDWSVIDRIKELLPPQPSHLEKIRKLMEERPPREPMKPTPPSVEPLSDSSPPGQRRKLSIAPNRSFLNAIQSTQARPKPGPSAQK